MKILRVVTAYWPHWGGNERWSFQHDQWFSGVAGDDVQVLVLRDCLPHHPAYREMETHGLRIPGPFSIAGLPTVRAHHEFLPRGRNVGLMRALYRLIRPWVERDVDLVITQIFHPYTYPCWRGKPVVLEAGWPLACAHGYANVDCRRTALMCATCFRSGKLRWWVHDQLKLAMLRRFDLIVGNEGVTDDLIKLGMGSKLHALRQIIDPLDLHRQAETPLQREQKALVEQLTDRYPFVLMQFNRLDRFKNPHLLLEVAERLPECGVVFAGDGLERTALEARVAGSPSLRDRVIFLGMVAPSCLGAVAARVSAFVMTSTIANFNTSLAETMALGIAPVVAVNTREYPAQFQKQELILNLPPDPGAMAEGIRNLLADPLRSREMIAAASRYISEHHSAQQMSLYRRKLLALADRYRHGQSPNREEPVVDTVERQHL